MLLHVKVVRETHKATDDNFITEFWEGKTIFPSLPLHIV